MTNPHKQNLSLLRQRVPVGIKHALSLLEAHNGDIDLAEKQFQNEMIAQAVERTGVSEDIAAAHLAFTNYDLTTALKSLYEQQYTLTERTLKLYKNDPETALKRIAYTIETQDKTRYIWADQETVDTLPRERRCLMVIVYCLLHDYWTMIPPRVGYHFNILLQHVTSDLNLPEVSKILQKAHDIDMAEIDGGHKVISTSGNDVESQELQEQLRLLELYRPQVIEALRDYVVKNITQFP